MGQLDVQSTGNMSLNIVTRTMTAELLVVSMVPAAVQLAEIMMKMNMI